MALPSTWPAISYAFIQHAPRQACSDLAKEITKTFHGQHFGPHPHAVVPTSTFVVGSTVLFLNLQTSVSEKEERCRLLYSKPAT